jgi:predicted transcriptional regulator
MTPTEIRNKHFAEIRATLSDRREAVYCAWVIHGPCTTRMLAQLSGIDLLNVRPRTTDLCDLGLVECVGTAKGEGVYKARKQAEWESWRDRNTGKQMELL